MPFRMNMLGMCRETKTRRPMFLKFGTHKFGRDLIAYANFG